MNIFSNIDPLLLGFIILTVATLILLGIVLWLLFRMRRFLIGFDSKHVGDSLNFVSSELNELKTFKNELEKYLSSVEKRLQKSVQTVKTVRFNPFKGTGGGGNQSFATSFLDQSGDGVVISSLYSRDHISVFSKPIKKHASEFELSNEEKEAIKKG
ncbi:MAG: DUF4446 family protein [Candidatus Paceibacterota bacterium]|jgi:hypothetical protein